MPEWHLCTTVVYAGCWKMNVNETPLWPLRLRLVMVWTDGCASDLGSAKDKWGWVVLTLSCQWGYRKWWKETGPHPSVPRSLLTATVASTRGTEWGGYYDKRHLDYFPGRLIQIIFEAFLVACQNKLLKEPGLLWHYQKVDKFVVLDSILLCFKHALCLLHTLKINYQQTTLTWKIKITKNIWTSLSNHEI
jgi:hypothetical protein